MENYNKNLYGIDWSLYLKMFPGKMRSPTIDRKMEVTMLQRLLDQGIINKEPVTLDPFWRNIVEEEKWGGDWNTYKKHFSGGLWKKIESLNFISTEYRALMMYVSSRTVSETFEKELEKDGCVCQFDEHDRIISIVSKNKLVDVGGKKLGNIAPNKNRKNKKKNEKDDEEDENKEEDKKEDEEDETKEEDWDQSNSVITIERFYDKLKSLIQTHCKRHRLKHSFVLELDQKSRDKEMSNFEMVKHLETISRSVVESEDEDMDVAKAKKFDILMIINSMASGRGYEKTEERMLMALNLECEREESISLRQLEHMIIEQLEE
ncbi:hypothetical protein GCK72_007735 [Caenorhabditis remanei]|uniref:SPK domain-containing protein n=1 Tax=Caenorhabditis remanei TaxID=31234 RepID=A0A6A5HM73_CAERE|nr:hypothetical protein GCK72_007735 [Caenorhabditis remanei]KAF1767776.1 hypothetical protein GCK72_007735 [Caenorhabditis remanei]